MKKLRLSALLFLPFLLRPAFANVHPVQLDKGTDTAQCVECHEDKTKGKNIHPAVSKGCMTCHLADQSQCAI